MFGVLVVVMLEGKVKWNDGKLIGSVWDGLVVKISGIIIKWSL